MTELLVRDERVLVELHPAVPDHRPEGRETARAAGLRYVSDTQPGIRRRRAGKGFYYLNPDGSRVSDPETLERLRALAIPPAWTDVWICPAPRGHIQASGRDAKGRKQYRYHDRWREVRDEVKYDRLIAFGHALPTIRARVEQDLARPGLSREKVLATVVRLLETTFIRVGNEEYARKNESYGLTTLKDDHVDVTGSTVRFQFRGKSGKEHAVSVCDRRVARIVKRCQELPGQDLFQYVDETGELRTLGSGDVNEYLKEITGQDFTAKDFRTWAGTVMAFLTLRGCEPCEAQAQLKKTVAQTVKSVSDRLGNTPAVCRKCYIHPAVLEAYADGSLAETLEGETVQDVVQVAGEGLAPEEHAVIRLLLRHLEQKAEPSRPSLQRAA